MKLFFSTALLLCCMSSNAAFAQFGLNGSAHPSAALDVKSPGNDKAFYPPRLTTPQRLAIQNPQAGAFVYDLDKGTMYLHDGQNWLPLAFANPGLLPAVGRGASDPNNSDTFGSSVAISGNYAIVGAQAKSVNSTQKQGVAYIFMRTGNGWTEQQRLVASDAASNDFFGIGVAISGDYAVVGAAGKAINGSASQGAAYVFLRTGNAWTQQQRLTASDGTANSGFGSQVAISGDYAVIGAPRKMVGANQIQGGAYIFARTDANWAETAQLVADDGSSYDRFGFSVAISGDVALVGAPEKNLNGILRKGAAYVFTRTGTTWSQIRLTVDGGSENDRFGVSAAIDGTVAVIGADGRNIGSNTMQGTAFVFQRYGAYWAQDQQLIIDAGKANDRFGIAVSISGNYIIVGSPLRSTETGTYQGAGYLFKKNFSWNLLRRVTDDTSSMLQIGSAVGISNGTFILGTNYSYSPGKVYFSTVD